MKTLTLGNSGQQISCIGLGTMYFGSKINESDSFEMLDYYSETGGTLLDSANKYASWIHGFAGGESETLIGKWMKQKGNREKMFITSKVGFPYGSIPRSLSRSVIISECEKSLKRLGTDTIDLYFAHAFDENTPTEETMEAFYHLSKSGKIKYAGASNYYGWQLSEANKVAQTTGWNGFCSLQQRHTCFEPSLRANFGTQIVLSPETMEFCKINNIQIMAYSPLLGGAYNRGFIPEPYQTEVNQQRLSLIKNLAQLFEVSPNAIVLAWMLQSSPPVIPLVTGSSTKQLQENFQAINLTLTTTQIEQLNSGTDISLKY